MMCIGINEYGEPRTCFCFSRQVKGCEDTKMRVATVEERNNHLSYLDMIW